MNDQLREAIDLALDNRWEPAHDIVQRFDDDPTAAWIHAVLHKIEGDHSNSRYWYQRAGQMPHVADNPTDELRTIRATLDRTGAD